MKIPMIYFDTSVISHLEHYDVTDKMQDTWRLWEAVKAGRFIACVSAVTIREIERCPEPKRSLLTKYLTEIPTLNLAHTPAVNALLDKYIECGVLTEKHLDDCQHIATATIYECDYIVSWNFRHFVDDMVIERVHTVNGSCGYCKPQIVSPTMLLKKEC